MEVQCNKTIEENKQDFVANKPIKKGKKRSTISKLAEKSRRSESGSESGSTYSLRGKQAKGNQTSEQTNHDNEAIFLKKESNVNNNSTYEILDKNSPKDTSLPKPSQGVISKNLVEGEVLPMDIDYESDENELRNDDLTISNKAPSDATIHRFRALKMANNEKNGTTDLIKSPFVPKPPSTPKTESQKSPDKTVPSTEKGSKKDSVVGKRNRDPYSSGEETAQLEHKSKRHSKMADKVGDKNKKVTAKKSTEKTIEADKNNLSSGNTKTDTEQKVEASATLPADSELNLKAAVNENYEAILHSSNLDSLPPKSPRSARLSPISPRTKPPPLPEDVVSSTVDLLTKKDAMPVFIKQNSIPGTSPRRQQEFTTQMSSNSILLPISSMEARLRTGSSGNLSVSSAVIGASELDRYFPERRLKVWIGTWNMGEVKEINNSLQDFILPESVDFLQDFYVVATQENVMHKKEWEITVQATLGPSHVLFHSASHGALHLAVFIRRDLIWFCSEPEEDQVTTRALTMVKTKGAVCISFSFFGTSFLFINSHFTSDAGKLKERISDYEKINSSIKLPKYYSGSQSNLQGNATARFDNVFWMGDLNFRLEKGRHTVEYLVNAITNQEHPNFEDLLLGDELGQCIYRDKAFHGYNEGRINFKPTYKFDINKDVYDTSPKYRIPSYTDRVLYYNKRKNSISCIHYDSVMNIRVSDHRPVYGVYEAAIAPGRDDAQLAAGKFDREVFVQACKRRAVAKVDYKGNQKSSGICSVQ